MNFIDNVYLNIKNSKKKVVTKEQVLKSMGLKTAFDLHAVESALNDLVKKDKLVKTAKGKYMLASNSAFIKSKLMGTKQGYAFARPINQPAEDIFIAERNLNGAVHGDTVLVSLERKNFAKGFKGSYRSNRQNGIVEKIVERGFTEVVGLFTINNGANLVIPDDQRFAESIFINPADTMRALQNSKVVVKIIDYPTRTKMALGKVIEILGDANDARVSTLSIIRSFGLIEEFPKSVIDEAKKVATPISEKEREGRKDFTDDMVITIDGEDARDFDDAFSIYKKDNKYYLNVHIADVSHYVKEGGEIDKEAFKRGTSVYFPDHVLPMLPVELSNDMCSLNPNVDRLTLSVEMVLDEKANVINYNVCKGIIHSKYRMTYTKVTKILNGDKDLQKEYSKIVPMLQAGAELATLLISRRDKAGQLDFDLPETQIVVDENYNTVDIVKKPRELADRLIEQFMVLTNEVVAKHFSSLNMPFVYRVHEDPTPEKIANFMGFVSGFGLKLNKSARPSDFQKLLISSKGQPYFTALSKVMLRSMQKARYAAENLGHFGLALKDYCHFTSPIRRLPDLVIHRIISYIITGELTDKKLNMLEEYVEEASLQASTTERLADEAERTVDDQKKAEFMVDKIGNVYEGTVSGASDNGVFVELSNTVEGMVKLESLPKDRYNYDDKRFTLVGKKHTYRLGDRMVVKVDSVDIISRHINFVLATAEEEAILLENKLASREIKTIK